MAKVPPPAASLSSWISILQNIFRNTIIRKVVIPCCCRSVYATSIAGLLLRMLNTHAIQKLLWTMMLYL